MANHLDSEQAFSGVAQTANLGTSTSVSSGAAKIFREFKWGLLTLFILMAVVVGLVYDGGLRKKNDASRGGDYLKGGLAGFGGSTTADNPVDGGSTTTPNGGTVTPPAGGTLGGTNTPIGGAPIITTPNRGGNAALLEDPRDQWAPEPINGQGIRRRPIAGQGGGYNSQDLTGQDNLLNPGDRSRDQVTTTPGIVRDNGTRMTMPKPGTSTDNNGAARVYVVKSGDNLTKIAVTNNLGKNGIKIILDANKEVLAHPDRLREGMKLKIPAPGAVAANSEVRTQQNGGSRGNGETRPEQRPIVEQQSADTYTVQQGDSLERIARRVLNDGRKWKELMEWNKDRLSDPTKLKVGMVLRVHGASATSAPAAVETPVRFQNNTVRAQHEGPVEESLPPESEVQPIPVAPVSASRKINVQRPQIPEPDNVPLTNEY